MKTPEELKQIWQDNPDGLAYAFGNMLREFGFNSLTDDKVKECIQRYYDNQPAPSLDVIDVFIRGYLEKGT